MSRVRSVTPRPGCYPTSGVLPHVWSVTPRPECHPASGVSPRVRSVTPRPECHPASGVLPHIRSVTPRVRTLLYCSPCSLQRTPCTIDKDLEAQTWYTQQVWKAKAIAVQIPGGQKCPLLECLDRSYAPLPYPWPGVLRSELNNVFLGNGCGPSPPFVTRESAPFDQYTSIQHD